MEQFRSRMGLIVALVGMAVGTGNIWRFPRIMAANGGGAFLIPWVLFLFLWSVPLLIVEFALGQKLRRGVVGCFSMLTNGKFAWLGGFVVFCTLGIMFYYSVVTGWCLYYLTESVTGGILRTDPHVLWQTFSQHSMLPLFFHGLCLGLTLVIISRGVERGIEWISLAMVPTLTVILILLAVYALTFSGRNDALNFMFSTDFSRLTDYKVWLEALSQSAWSTGAGWGIALSYACYSRSHDDPVLTPFTTGLGNNAISLAAAFAIIPTLFSFFPFKEVLKLTGSGNTGLTFIVLPQLFQKMQGGQIVAILFFAALFLAAFTSLISMVELGVRFCADLGIDRSLALWILGVVGFVMGAPSALNMKFFNNQDWVWGIGLLISGFFFALLMRHIGIDRFSREFVPLRRGWNRRLFSLLVLWLIPVQFVALIGWWFYQSVTWAPEAWWNPLRPLSVGTCLVQWGILLAALFALNSRLHKRAGGTL